MAAATRRALAAAAERCGSALLMMVVLPADWELRHGVREPATDRLLTAVQGDGLDILDLRTPVQPDRVLRLPNDNHYNPAAADWAAAQIAARLREMR